jgi:hypothetical protein
VGPRGLPRVKTQAEYRAKTQGWKPAVDTGLTTLGFASNWGAVVLAYMFMQLHITIAFSVILNPAFYITERLFMGMHKQLPEDIENNLELR